MNKDSKIYVAGHRGLVGSAIVRKLKAEGFHNLVLKTSAEVDLRNQAVADAFFAENCFGNYGSHSGANTGLEDVHQDDSTVRERNHRSIAAP